MQLIAYIIIYPLLWIISILPFPLLYLLSDFCYVFIYYIIGYRKKVVRENLRLVYPEKDAKELKKIEKAFYHHMCDMFLEMVKSLTISTKEMKKRFVFPNVDVLKKYEEQQQGIILMCAHYASWEWMTILEEYISLKGFGVYKKLQNKYFDKLVRSIREKRNTVMISTKQTIKVIETNQQNNLLGIYAMLSDQSPKPEKAYHWTDFMNVKVPCFTGAEMLARKFDMPMLYFKVEKTKRGHYKGTFIPLHQGSVNELPKYKATELFYRELEKQLHEAPPYYFWIHKRWKHRDKVPEKYTS